MGWVMVIDLQSMRDSGIKPEEDQPYPERQ